MSESEMLRRMLMSTDYYSTAEEIAERAELGHLTHQRQAGLLRKLATVGLVNVNALDAPARYGQSRSGEFVKKLLAHD